LTRRSSPTSSSWPGHPLLINAGWATTLFVVWALIAGFLFLRLAVSLWHVRQLGREAREVSNPELMTVVQDFQAGRKVRLCVSDLVRVPTAIGFFRPSIVLPSWVLEELPPDELKVILLHELAHLRRWDDWTNLVQKYLKAIFFFHPAVWWIESRLVLERELACDDMVVSRTRNPRAYAASLVSLAERTFAKKRRLGRALAMAQNALGRLQQTSTRLAEILNTQGSRSRNWRPAVGIVAVLTLAVFGTLPYTPEVVGFSNNVKGSSASRESASVRLNTVAKPRVVGVAQKTVLPQKPRIEAIPASVRWSQKTPRRSLVTRTSYPARKSAEMLLVVETETSESGQAVWTFCVWRIDSGEPSMRNVEESIVLNSI
jgi:beta-lactamase regulating signal transducer with metallopeptidase domain